MKQSPNEVLKEFRKSLGLTQEAMGDLLGYCGSTIYRMEKNQQPFTPSHLETLAKKRPDKLYPGSWWYERFNEAFEPEEVMVSITINFRKSEVNEFLRAIREALGSMNF